jgi:dihydrofolate reductase
MPWHLPVDLKHFKSLTLGKPVIVGRKAFEAIGKPLPGRRNMVVAHNRGLYTDGIEVAHSLRDALVLAAGTRAFRGRHFPAALDPGGWRETAREDHATDRPFLI